MKTIKAISLVVAAMVAPNLQAGEIIDFASMADNGYSAPNVLNTGEKGFLSFIFNGIGFDLTITAGYQPGTGSGADGAIVGNNEPEYAYLDANHAGLGVCGKLTAGLQCNPSSDDNVTGLGGATLGNEILTFVFSNFGTNQLTIDKLWLNNTHDDDKVIGSSDSLLVNGLSTAGPGNGYAPQDATANPTSKDYNGNGGLLANVGNFLMPALTNGNTFTLGYGGDSPEQFYVSGMEVSVLNVPNEVPVPGSLLLLGAGLMGLRFARRGGKK